MLAYDGVCGSVINWLVVSSLGVATYNVKCSFWSFSLFWAVKYLTLSFFMIHDVMLWGLATWSVYSSLGSPSSLPRILTVLRGERADVAFLIRIWFLLIWLFYEIESAADETLMAGWIRIFFSDDGWFCEPYEDRLLDAFSDYLRSEPLH